MTIILDDKRIDAKIQDKVKAEEKYDDAVSKGNVGVILKQDKE